MSSVNLADRLSQVHKSEIRKIFESAPADSINLGLGEIQFNTPDLILETAGRILNSEIIRYTPNAGLSEARESVATYYDKDNFDGENVCLTAGVTEGIFICVFSLVNPGDEVLIANPAFVAYETVVRMAGGIPIFFDLDPDKNFQLNKDSFRQAISSRTKLIILNNPSNPLGIVFSKDEIDFILEQRKRIDAYLLVDEIYRDLYIRSRPESMLSSDEMIIIASGLSKTHCMTGWRIGWLITSNLHLMKAFINTHQYINTCAPFLSQKIMPVALSSAGIEAADKIRQKLILNRKLILTFFQKIKGANILVNDASPYLFVNLGIDDLKLTRQLSRKGIIVIPGSVFGKNGKNWIRINYGISENQLKKVFTRFESVLSLILLN